jgi:hypothetical protein
MNARMYKKFKTFNDEAYVGVIFNNGSVYREYIEYLKGETNIVGVKNIKLCCEECLSMNEVTFNPIKGTTTCQDCKDKK